MPPKAKPTLTKKPKNITPFPKPKKDQPTSKPNTKTTLLEQMSNLILKGTISLQDKPRVWTPFTVNQGVMLKIGNGKILAVEPDQQDQNDLFVCGGALSSYTAIATRMSKHYDESHLLLIKRYLTLPSNSNVSTIDDFNNLIKKKWPRAPISTLMGTKTEKERARKALNYLSAILMFAEPYRFQDKGEKSLDLINSMIRKYNPPKTPSKKLLGNKKGKGHPLVKKGALKAARKLIFEDTPPKKK